MIKLKVIAYFLAIGMICTLFGLGQSYKGETHTYNGSQFIEIIQPKEKENVSWNYAVEGNSSATKESGLKVYLLIWPIEPDGPWWVQSTTTFSDGRWRSLAFFGRDPRTYPEDNGTSYRAIAIMTNQTFGPNMKLNELPDVPLSARSQEVIVIRT